MIKSQKAVFEKVEPQFGSSFRYQTFDHSTPNKNNNFWHYHPEIELVYISSGSGKRQIGSHVSYYRQGDLILIGSNLPHCGFTSTLNRYERETVAMAKISPELAVGFARTINLFVVAIIKDLSTATNEGVFFKEFLDILRYRSAQYFGIYSGYKSKLNESIVFYLMFMFDICDIFQFKFS